MYLRRKGAENTFLLVPKDVFQTISLPNGIDAPWYQHFNSHNEADLVTLLEDYNQPLFSVTVSSTYPCFAGLLKSVCFRPI